MTSLNKSGFITQYLYSGKKESLIEDKHQDTNQLRYEKYLRSIIAKHKPINLPEHVQMGELCDLGMPWKYFYSHENSFLEMSSFYLELRRVDAYAYTELVVQEDMTVETAIWSCCAVDLWVNEEAVGGLERPVYKPIQSVRVKLPLKKGVNRLFARLETLGVRDTRISLGIQILEKQEQISVTLSESEAIKAVHAVATILDSAVLKNGKISFAEHLPPGSTIKYDTENYDFTQLSEKYISKNISGYQEITLEAFPGFQIQIEINNQIIKRNFEQIELRQPIYLESNSVDHRETVFKEIGKVASLTRGANDGFALFPMLARYHTGDQTDYDIKAFDITLSQIERRMDCADFMTCALIRFIKNYEVDAMTQAKIKKTMLNFRYWMDEDGMDGMCFWSENHSLMFYQTAYFFGQMYEEDVFIRSGRTGKEMVQRSERLLKEWLEDLCESGYDEFNSGVYSPITFAALLNIVDYASEELSLLAKKACDMLIYMMAIHCFKGVVISPQGRVYRSAIYPGLQSLQALVNYVQPEAPYIYCEWLSALATSSYEFPSETLQWMESEGSYSYTTSNAVIDITKTRDYIITSVQSPRRDGGTRKWTFNMQEDNRENYSYTKSLNECFHGTMEFEPGTLGYQQHLWYAALDNDLVVFTNHPGGSCEDLPETRPGYWYGNGTTPAIKQVGNTIGIVYQLPESHPIDFVHLFWNEKGFSETGKEGNWLFGRKGSSYIGVWCSEEMVDFDDVLFECEKRTYGREIAYVTVCGSQVQDGSFSEFRSACKIKDIRFENGKTLHWDTETVEFHWHEQTSQYVD